MIGIQIGFRGTNLGSFPCGGHASRVCDDDRGDDCRDLVLNYPQIEDELWMWGRDEVRVRSILFARSALCVTCHPRNRYF
jgi:hypothetical protein